jgi:hypothetical protein
MLLFCLAPSTLGLNTIASYSNLWVDPDYIIARRFAVETDRSGNEFECGTTAASERVSKQRQFTGT